MERIDKILNHDLFSQYMASNEACEKERVFCRHDLGHSLDVARIAMILNLDEKVFLDREWIYAAALLHDIGRHVQYADGTPHEAASAKLAPEILSACGFDNEETCVILSAIANHRNKEVVGDKSLDDIIYRADKASRACFGCKAEAECNWKEDKKNLTIKW